METQMQAQSVGKISIKFKDPEATPTHSPNLPKADNTLNPQENQISGKDKFF